MSLANMDEAIESAAKVLYAGTGRHVRWDELPKDPKLAIFQEASRRAVRDIIDAFLAHFPLAEMLATLEGIAETDTRNLQALAARQATFHASGDLLDDHWDPVVRFLCIAPVDLERAAAALEADLIGESPAADPERYDMALKECRRHVTAVLTALTAPSPVVVEQT